MQQVYGDWAIVSGRSSQRKTRVCVCVCVCALMQLVPLRFFYFYFLQREYTTCQRLRSILDPDWLITPCS